MVHFKYTIKKQKSRQRKLEYNKLGNKIYKNFFVETIMGFSFQMLINSRHKTLIKTNLSQFYQTIKLK